VTDEFINEYGGRVGPWNFRFIMNPPKLTKVGVQWLDAGGGERLNTGRWFKVKKIMF
jgi:hypothetical protein